APVAHSGDSRYREAATAITSGIDRHGEVPGLKSVARAMIAPDATRSATGGGADRRNIVEVGSRTAAVSAPARARTPSGLMLLRWSALRTPSAAAASAAPEGPSWPAWQRTSRPWRLATAETL